METGTLSIYGELNLTYEDTEITDQFFNSMIYYLDGLSRFDNSIGYDIIEDSAEYLTGLIICNGYTRIRLSTEKYILEDGDIFLGLRITTPLFSELYEFPTLESMEYVFERVGINWQAIAGAA